MIAFLTMICMAASIPTSDGMSLSAFTPATSTSFTFGLYQHTLMKLHRPTTTKTNARVLSMKIKVGLIGLPNVGKSTLFNAVAQKSIAEARNFPFCTIEPNVTPIPIPDDDTNHTTLKKLATLAKSTNALPSNIFLVDVAGLVKGASKGEGLGNKFLATVRECDLIVHVVRSYIDDDIIHVSEKIDPVSDADIVNLELILADLAQVQRRLDNSACDGMERCVLLLVENALENGLPARSLNLSIEEVNAVKSMGLLSLKPMIYAFNVDEVDFALNWSESMYLAGECMKQLQYCDMDTDSCMVVSAKLESDIGALSSEQRCEYLESIGAEFRDPAAESRLWSYHNLPLRVKEVLHLGLVYTGPGVPPERSRTTKAHILSSFSNNGMTAFDLAGKLHGDIQKGFIRAEVIQSQDLIGYENYSAAKEDGRIRTEGKEYVLTNGDVVLIKWR
ncbi:hypothetical protein ACHAWU_003497 [Discostella pseudostelligera]|uniref:OBG-type G domain-containing protein n=1 Tax=Discostella pseudostelligera TaxID=259834 RepID=A0ABD3LZD0_9STRA